MMPSKRMADFVIPPPPMKQRAAEKPRAPEPIVNDDYGFGVNLTGREDVYDIPTYLRRQMD